MVGVLCVTLYSVYDQILRINHGSNLETVVQKL